MVELKRYLLKRIMLIVLMPLRIFPIKKDRIILDNSLSHTYSDNPKYVIKKLCENTNKPEIILTLGKKTSSDEIAALDIKTTIHQSLLYYYYAMTSAVYVTNSGGYSYLPLRKSQIVINTWHGGGCYKIMGLDKNDVTDFFKREVRLAADKTDVMLSTCEAFASAVKKALLIQDEAIMRIGMPRNDILVNYKSNESQEKRKEVRERLGIKDENQRLVLFSPTYRKAQDRPFGESVAISYGVDEEKVCEALHHRFGGNWVFGYRLHPNVRNSKKELPANVKDMSDYDDMQELILAADVMINDFSSCMWDFMLTGKPCFTFALDLQHYIEATKVYTPVEKWPFPKAETNEELIRNIEQFDEERYKKDCNTHYKELGGCESGKASEIVSDIIMQHCGLKK